MDNCAFVLYLSIKWKKQTTETHFLAQAVIKMHSCSFHHLCFLVCYLQDMSLKCNEEGKSLSTETFAKVSLTNLRRQAVPDLSSDLGMNIFKKVRDIFYITYYYHIKTVVVLTGKLFPSVSVQEPA